VGFPGESAGDLAELERFLTLARLDVVGVFGYSDEDGTEAATHEGKLSAQEIAARVESVSRLVEELTAQRAEERVGDIVEVLVEQGASGELAEGRAAHQGPEVDGTTTLAGAGPWRVGEIVRAVVVASCGVDLVAEPLPGQRR
jgi:ribosomal protein S12 methylthiotransferase